MKLLIVEDEKSIRTGIVSWLEKSGFDITEAEDGQQAVDIFEKGNFDLIVLDIMMPKMDGNQVLDHIRNTMKNNVPIIMLTAKGSETDIINALNNGADDYIVKPFSNRELEARINANLRKYQQVDKVLNATTDLFEIDNQKYIISKGNTSSELTRKEMDLLLFMISHEGSYLKKNVLLEEIWGNLDTDDTRTLDIHISKLRKKLENIGVNDVIVTKRGLGYGFVSSNAN